MNFIKLILLFIFCSLLYSKDYNISNINEYNKLLNSNTIKAGDKIILKNGIWKNVKLILKGNGSFNKPIILEAQTPSKVIITGKSSLLMVGNFLIVRNLIFKNGEPAYNPLITIGTTKQFANYCRFTNNIIDNFNRKNLNDKYHWVRILGFHNRVDHCKFTNMKNRGVTLKVSILPNQKEGYNIIDYNEFSFRKAGKQNGYETIRVGNSKVSSQSAKTLIANNYFYNCNGEIEIISNKSCNNFYIHNTFKNSNGMLTLRNGNNCVIKDNFFINTNNSLMGGIRITGKNHKIDNNYFYNVGVSPIRASISLFNSKKNEKLDGYLPVNNIIISHNKFIQTNYTIFSGANYKSKSYNISPQNIIIKNNIFVKNKNLFSYFGNKPLIKFNNNILYKTINKEILKNSWYLNPKLKLKKNIYISNINTLFNESNIFPIKQKDVGPTWLK